MLVQPKADNACFRVKHTREVHVHARNLDAWDQEYEQTSPGVFHGEVRELFDDKLQVFEEVASCATAQYCRAWPGGVWIGLSVQDNAEGLRFMGRPTQAQDLMLAGGEDAFDLQVPAGQGLYGLVLGHQELDRHLREVHGVAWLGADAASRVGDGPRVQRLTPWQRWRLVGMLREVLRSLQEAPGVLAHEASRLALREALLSVLCDTLAPQALQPVGTERHQRRQDLVHRVRQLVLDQPQEAIGIQQLCAALHVTRRTLQNCFQDVLGISPAAYLRTVRLNAVRRALREQPGTGTIADVAAQWGFWHMGHFSQDYKALFGESPSQTRAATRH